MAFADFDLKTACVRFGLTIEERINLFAAVQAVEVPALGRVLETSAPAALAMSSGESAFGDDRSLSILMEAVRMLGGRVGLFSGISLRRGQVTSD